MNNARLNFSYLTLNFIQRLIVQLLSAICACMSPKCSQIDVFHIFPTDMYNRLPYSSLEMFFIYPPVHLFFSRADTGRRSATGVHFSRTPLRTGETWICTLGWGHLMSNLHLAFFMAWCETECSINYSGIILHTDSF